MKLPKEILTKFEDDNGTKFQVIVGYVDDLGNIDADDGDRLAIYRLVKTVRYRLNPRLEK